MDTTIVKYRSIYDKYGTSLVLYVEFKNSKIVNCWDSMSEIPQSKINNLPKKLVEIWTTKSQINNTKRNIEKLKIGSVENV